MSKLSAAFLFCFIAIALGGNVEVKKYSSDIKSVLGEAEKTSDVIADTKENFEFANVLVKREATDGKETGKGKNKTQGKKGGNVKKEKKARKKKGGKCRNKSKEMKNNRNVQERNPKKGGNKVKIKGNKKIGKKEVKRNGMKKGRRNGKKKARRNGKKEGRRNGKKEGRRNMMKKGRRNVKEKGNRNSKKKGTTKNKRKSENNMGKGVINGNKRRKNKLIRKKKPEQKNLKERKNDTSCLTKLIKYSRSNSAAARTVFREVSRSNRFQVLLGKKKKKKGNFRGTHNTLLSALGGNEKSLECDGKPITNGTSGMAKYRVRH